MWTRSTYPQPWIDPDTMAPINRDFTVHDLGAVLDARGVRTAVVVQSSNIIAETRRLLANRGRKRKPAIPRIGDQSPYLPVGRLLRMVSQ